jgi:hypothetical protein
LDNFAKYIIENGGDIYPLIIPSNLTNGTGLMNPSIYNLDGKLIVNLRHVNYTFYHSEAKLFQHPYGPLTYVHPENDMHLRTENYYCELDKDFNIARFDKIFMTHDTYEPIWEFVGLEDARIFKWDDKLFICGVRRDTTPNGQGRMELCEIEVRENEVVELTRFRIPPPKDPNSYCEKNWMPILDRPYHFVKWSNPTEVVEVNPEKKTCNTVSLTNAINLPRDLRGGSQIIPWGDLYITVTHEVDLFNSEVGRKDAVYRHRFVVWDKEFNIVKHSKDFSIMNGHVEFAVGLCHYEGDVLMSFGYQDNAAYILRMDPQSIVDFINM